jgi:hypothetical protein
MAKGYALTSTGGGFWAAIKVLNGVEFWVTDYDESRYPDPTRQLNVGAYRPNSGEWLEFTRTASNLTDVERELESWSAALQEALSAPEPGAPSL